MSLNRPFPLNSGGGEDAGGTRAVELPSDRVRQWQSFITGLEEDCALAGECDDALFQLPVAEADAQKKGSEVASPAAAVAAADDEPVEDRFPHMKSLFMQQLRAGGHRSGFLDDPGSGRMDAQLAAPAPLPSSLPLREWVEHFKNDQPGHFQVMGMANGVGKDYIEKAVRVALSLAKEVAKQHDAASGDTLVVYHEQDVVAENAQVTNTENGEATFTVKSSLANGMISPPSQREMVVRLGRIFYELFTQNQIPPLRSEQTQAPSSCELTSFDCTLKIGPNDVIDDNSQHSVELQGKQKQRRRVDKGMGPRYHELLEVSGMPSTTRRLVSDMLGSGDLFSHDQSFAVMSDVVSDLQQMADDPHSFLHDSLLMRCRPIIPDKLYGRECELRQCLDVADAVSSERSQSAIMISGGIGDGKSRLMKEVRNLLDQKGWQSLHCKFDQDGKQPLSTFCLAFDRFLSDYIVDGNPDGCQEIRAQITNAFGAGGIEMLCHLLPTLRKPVQVEDSCPQPHDFSFDAGNATSKCRLHHLFGFLMKVFYDRGRPLLVCMDDLQWAGASVLELIISLIEGMDKYYIGEEGSSGHSPAVLLFMGCFRSNEFAEYPRPLQTCIQQLMKNCKSVSLSEINLGGISTEAINSLVSDSLRFPQRLTKPLSNLIHKKSTGNPLFAREFLCSLVNENLLTFSYSRREWQFDLDLIELKTVSDGVVDLLMRRLQTLPNDVISGLNVMSCFGSEVELDVLMHLSDVCGVSDITAALDSATDELLLVRKSSAGVVSYSFVHDTIQETVYRGIKPHERVDILKKSVDALIFGTLNARSDTILFIIADFIKRIGRANTNDSESRHRYAGYSLLAGEKAIPDFASASIYLESGLSFLDDGHWAQSYELSLELFKKSAFVQWGLGETSLMNKRIDAVLKYANCYDDKLDSIIVLIQSLADGKSGTRAFSYSLEVLEQLGEEINEDGDAGEELKSIQQSLPASLHDLPEMKEKRKIRAMCFLHLALYQSHRLKSTRHFPLISCRMVTLTLKYGFNVYSPLGITGLAMSYAAVFQNYAEGYRLGKIAVALASDKSPQILPDVTRLVMCLVNIWVEPMQVAMPHLLEVYEMALKNGSITIACVIAMSYLNIKFFTGAPLQSIDKEMTTFLRTASRLNRVFPHIWLVPVSNAICSLTGGPQRSVWDGIQGFEEDNKNLAKAFENKEFLLAERIIVIKIMTGLIFREYEEAGRIIRQYHQFFDIHESERPVNIIYRTFFTGLIAFVSMRGKQDSAYWRDIGLNATEKMETWAKASEWNFANKLHLLRAEHHASTGNLDGATEEYELSITSARDHRFVHEEAIACELAGLFHQRHGRKESSDRFLRRAYECYESWGAKTKANAVLQSLEKTASVIPICSLDSTNSS